MVFLLDHGGALLGASKDMQYAQTGRVGALIPLETEINMSLNEGITSTNPLATFAIQDAPGVYTPWILGGPDAFKYKQTLPQYEYNSVFCCPRDSYYLRRTFRLS